MQRSKARRELRPLVTVLGVRQSDKMKQLVATLRREGPSLPFWATVSAHGSEFPFVWLRSCRSCEEPVGRARGTSESPRLCIRSL